MNEITITFDQVFDVVHRSQRNRVLSTQFGFQSGDMKKVGVTVPGSPRIEAGMTVTALLERPGDWQSLLGWVNHETGEIACRRAASNIGGVGAIVLGSLLAYHLAGTQPCLAALVAVISIACCVGGIVGMRKAVRARRYLETARMTVAPRDAGSNA